jgi:hypothetical protein
MAVKPDLSKAADVLKNLDLKKAEGDAGKPSAKPKPNPKPGPSKVKTNTKASGKSGGAAHMRSSNRGK